MTVFRLSPALASMTDSGRNGPADRAALDALGSTREHMAALRRSAIPLDTHARLRRWGLILGGWTVYGLVSYQQSLLAAGVDGRTADRTDLLLLSMGTAWVWALLTPMIILLARRWRIDRASWPRSIALHTPVALVLAVIDVSAYGLLLDLAGLPRPSVVYALLYRIDYSLFMYALIVAFTHAADYHALYRDRRVRTAQLETRLSRSQLQALRTQLQPHLLFNTLNSISELVHQEPETAERMITRLGDLLRLSLDSNDSQEVALEKELELLGAYLDIEQLRFGDRLAMELAIEPETLGACVPSLVLQPLVENAIRHGTAPRAVAGRIRVSAARRADHLIMEVTDNGRGLPANGAVLREGVGLGNTRARLEQLYGTNHRFTLENARESGVRATISIPFTTQPRQSSAKTEAGKEAT
ncbi:MAG: sensor histidine kinase [Gemmatimonadaceae bacterium]